VKELKETVNILISQITMLRGELKKKWHGQLHNGPDVGQLELLLFNFLFSTSFYMAESEYHKNEAVVASERPIFGLCEPGNIGLLLYNTETHSCYYCCCYYRQ
jgi:hypothetical protein